MGYVVPSSETGKDPPQTCSSQALVSGAKDRGEDWVITRLMSPDTLPT